MITSLDQLDLNAEYTYADYILRQFHERVEQEIYQALLPNVEGDVVGITFLPGFGLKMVDIFEECYFDYHLKYY